MGGGGDLGLEFIIDNNFVICLRRDVWLVPLQVELKNTNFLIEKGVIM